MNSRVILARIHAAIDNDDSIEDKTAMKRRYTHSMNAFLRHGNRTINSVVGKTVHKLGSHFDSLNFSDTLPRFATYGRKSQGYAFSFTASLYNVFDGNNAALVTPGDDTLGVDPLLCEIMKTPTNEQHMSDIIEYSLIKKSAYVDSPASYDALHKYLQKRKERPANNAPVSEKVTKVHKSSHDGENNSAAKVDEEVSSGFTAEANEVSSGAPLVMSANSGRHQFGSSFLSAESFPLSPQPASEQEDGCATVNKTLFQSTPSPLAIERAGSFENTSIVLDNADQLRESTSSCERVSNSVQATAALRKFVQVLLSDVKQKSGDNKLFLKLNTKHNMRVTRNLALMKFLEANEALDDTELYDLFCASTFFKSLSCAMFIPFKLRDQYNIEGDGYCFYRALFVLLLREESGFKLTAAELKELDYSLKDVTVEGSSLRDQFQLFFARLEALFPDRQAKSKVATAGCTFSHLSTYLDERFWGGNDSVPFLDFVCTAFSHNRDEQSTLSGCWAKMFCSSIFGIVNGRDTLNYDSVGDAYSLHDVLMVLMRPHNWLLHKQVHFFVGDHPPVDVFLKSFSHCVSSMLVEIRMRIVAAKGEDSIMTFTDVYDRLDQGLSTPDDIEWLIKTRCALERQLTENNVNVGDTEAPPSPTTSPFSSKHTPKEDYLPTPFGATQEQKIYISTINNTVRLCLLTTVVFINHCC